MISQEVTKSESVRLVGMHKEHPGYIVEYNKDQETGVKSYKKLGKTFSNMKLAGIVRRKANDPTKNDRIDFSFEMDGQGVFRFSLMENSWECSDFLNIALGLRLNQKIGDFVCTVFVDSFTQNGVQRFKLRLREGNLKTYGKYKHDEMLPAFVAGGYKQWTDRVGALLEEWEGASKKEDPPKAATPMAEVPKADHTFTMDGGEDDDMPF